MSGGRALRDGSEEQRLNGGVSDGDAGEGMSTDASAVEIAPVRPIQSTGFPYNHWPTAAPMWRGGGGGDPAVAWPAPLPFKCLWL